MSERKVIVEIGPGRIPLIEYSENLVAGSLYVGIDKSISKVPPDVQVLGDLGGLPIKDNTADEVWMLNLFGDMWADWHGNFDTFVNQEGETVLNGGMRYIFTDLARITKQGGNVYIGEFYTPPPSLPYFDLSPFSFKTEVLQNDDYDEFCKTKCLRSWVRRENYWGFADSPYFLILTKTSS